LSFGNPAPATPAPAAPTAPAPPAAPLVEHHSDSGLSPEAVTMAGWIREDLAKGRMTQADADKAFDELGTPLDQRTTPPDARTDEQLLLDAHFSGAKPEEYQIRYTTPGQMASPMTKALAQFDQSARAWLSGAGFPRETGNSLVNAIAKVAQTTKAMTPDQLETYGVNEFQKLQRAHGPALDEKLQAVDRMVQVIEAKQPGLVHLLKSKGIMDNAMVANMLIAHAQISHARKR
jgi:hypothetical protein